MNLSKTTEDPGTARHPLPTIDEEREVAAEPPTEVIFATTAAASRPKEPETGDLAMEETSRDGYPQEFEEIVGVRRAIVMEHVAPSPKTPVVKVEPRKHYNDKYTRMLLVQATRRLGLRRSRRKNSAASPCSETSPPRFRPTSSHRERSFLLGKHLISTRASHRFLCESERGWLAR